MLILQSRVSFRRLAQASRVAPVVKTSSTSSREGVLPLSLNLCLICPAFLKFTLKAFWTFFHLSILSFWVWVRVNLFLSSSLFSVATEGAVCLREASIPRHTISDWLYPLFLFFLGWRGTGTIRSIS